VSAVILDPNRPSAPAPTRAPAIVGALVGVMSSVGAVGKNSKNKDQGYAYRGIDDVMPAVHSALVANDVVALPRVLQRLTEQRPRQYGGVMYVTHVEVMFRFVSAADGSVEEVIVWGEGADVADKSTSKAQTMALKYALLHALMIPTEDIVDGDAETPDPQAGPRPNAPARARIDGDWVLEAERRTASARSTDDLGAVWNAIGEALSAGRIDRPTADRIANGVTARRAELAAEQAAAEARAQDDAAEAPHEPAEPVERPAAQTRAAQDAAAETPPPAPPEEAPHEAEARRVRAARIARQYSQEGTPQ
jgi:hypothetical protein